MTDEQIKRLIQETAEAVTRANKPLVDTMLSIVQRFPMVEEEIMANIAFRKSTVTRFEHGESRLGNLERRASSSPPPPAYGRNSLSRLNPSASGIHYIYTDEHGKSHVVRADEADRKIDSSIRDAIRDVVDERASSAELGTWRAIKKFTKKRGAHVVALVLGGVLSYGWSAIHDFLLLLGKH